VRVSCKGNKEAWLTKVPYDSHRVLKELLHKAIAARKARRENKATANIARTDVLADQSVRKSRIDVRTDILLVGAEPVERGSLTGNVHIDDVLLKEAAGIKERGEGWTNVEVVPVKDPLLEPYPLTGPGTVL
jgi:hypothetical protein